MASKRKSDYSSTLPVKKMSPNPQSTALGSIVGNLFPRITMETEPNQIYTELLDDLMLQALSEEEKAGAKKRLEIRREKRVAQSRLKPTPVKRETLGGILTYEDWRHVLTNPECSEGPRPFLECVDVKTAFSHLQMSTMSPSHPLSYAIIMNVVLNRRKKHKPSKQDKYGADETIWTPSVSQAKQLQSEEKDGLFSCWIVMFPMSNVLFTTMTANVPLPIGWLRMEKDGTLRGGSLVRRINKTVALYWIEEKRAPTTVMNAFELPDSSKPPLAPDIVPDELKGVCFSKLLFKSSSNKSRARCFVKGTGHRSVADSGAFVWDPLVQGDLDISLSQGIDGLCSAVDDSIISVKVVKDNRTVIAVKTCGDTIASIKKGGNARKDSGDTGGMMSLGFNLNPAARNGKETVMTRSVLRKFLPGMCTKFAEQISWKFPGLLPCLRSFERCEGHGVIPSASLGGVDGITANLDFSVDLGNASHKDTSDGGPGISIWAEKVKGKARNWYMVFPNVLVKSLWVYNKGGVWVESKQTHDYEGLAIKLSDGVCILWNGRVIRHCTSYTEVGEDNHTYGAFFGPKGEVMRNAGVYKPPEPK